MASRNGLCASCIHDSGCTYPRDPSKPIHQCEQFEDVNESSLSDDSLRRYNSRSAYCFDEKGGDGKKSLCRTCALLDTCTFTKPDDGVWNCEEYREKCERNH